MYWNYMKVHNGIRKIICHKILMLKSWYILPICPYWETDNTSQPDEAKRTDSVMTIEVPTNIIQSIDAVLCVSHSGCDLTAERNLFYHCRKMNVTEWSTLYFHFLMNVCSKVAFSIVFIHFSTNFSTTNSCFTIMAWLFPTWWI